MKQSPSLKKFKKNKGVLLFETALGTVVIGLLLAQHIRFVDNERQIRTAKNVGDHIKRVGEAADRFINDNYGDITKYALGIPVDNNSAVRQVFSNAAEGGVAGCDISAGTCTFTVSGLAQAGYLKNNSQFFNNPVDVGYAIQAVVRKQDGSRLNEQEIAALAEMAKTANNKTEATTENSATGTSTTTTETVGNVLSKEMMKHLTTPVINGIVVTTQPWTNSRGMVNYSLVGEAVQQAGVDAGSVGFAKGRLEEHGVYGYKSNWYLDREDIPLLGAYDEQDGILAYRFGFHSNNNTDFLRRDGTLPMTGNLHMAGNPIHLDYNGPSITGKDGEVNISGPVNISNPNVTNEGEVPPAIEAEGWVCATNEKPAKICMGGDRASDGNAENFQIRMFDNRPLLIHNPDMASKGVNDFSTIGEDGKDKVVLRVGGSLAVHDNLYIGDRTNIGDADRFGKDAVNNTAIKNETGVEGGNIVSNYNIGRGGVILNKGGNVADATRTIGSTGKDRYENPHVATEFKPDGTIITNSIYIKDPGKSASNGVDSTDGNGLHISQIIPSYSSRGAFIVQDEDVVQKPNCQWKPNGQDKAGIGRAGVPRIILSWGNLQTSGDEVDQTSVDTALNVNDPASIKRYLQEKAMTKHRVILKAEDMGEQSNSWRMIVKTRNFDGSGWASAGQAVAHVYCQLY